ncbi:hypothetical protein [Nonlabens marinus]|uniref:Sperm nuclear basic protein PL-I n=1 Tax=Nonlabens marinus S1-08 TaxID=1454201 RepID=W8W0J7_9FLAO|nr:hypothetical protein [Nonlabens marinus]BAO56446.1 hypothetical protein NMS_2437 [Nonlabens marinus S1-08]
MKKLSTLLAVLFLGFGIAHAEKVESDDRYRGYTDNFIFVEDGIEFAVFPDGQFDFNYLNNGPQLNGYVDLGNVNISFNTGFDYDPYVQYDQYGAVIQIENTPIYYDSYGRVIQAGDVFINYRNGYVNRIGNLYVRYSRPGIILNYTGYINVFNRHYVYQPWHRYYAAPFVDRVVVYSTPYRAYYNPIRFSYNYHRTYWNTPTYYNGCFASNRARRSFYRPYDHVVYNDYERGRRNSRGRVESIGRRTENYRKEIATGRNSISRSNNNRSNGRLVSNTRSSESRGYSNNKNNASGIAGRSTDMRNSRQNDSRSNGRSDSAISGRNSNQRGIATNNRNSSANQRSSRSTGGAVAQSRKAQTSDRNENANRSYGNTRSNSGRSVGSQREATPRKEQSSNRTSRARTSPQRSQREQAAPQRAQSQQSAPQRSQRQQSTRQQQRTSRPAAQKSAPSRRSESSSRSRSSSSRSSGRSNDRGRG